MSRTCKNTISIKDNLIILENDTLRIVIDKDNGGKIRSFISKIRRTEFFYQDSRPAFSHDSFSRHDFSGFDECFPTVAPCQYDDGCKIWSYEDHGFLWQNPLKTDILSDCVVMSREIHSLKCRFERTCRFEKQNCLRLDYKITHKADKPLPYLYSAHPMLRATEHTRLILPEQMNTVYWCCASENTGLPVGSWTQWPAGDHQQWTGPFTFKKHRYIKFFTTRLSEGIITAVHHLDTNESLRFLFDTKTLPYLGVLVVEGYDILADNAFTNEIFLGLEPATGIGDDLNVCRSTKTLNELLPGDEITFWIKLEVY